MPLITPTDAPYPKAFLAQFGGNYYVVLCDAAGRLQIDVVDAAGLQDALASVNTDALIAAGTDAGNVPRILLLDAARHLQVDVIASGLPLGAATAANQALILAQVQLIEDLRDALQSVNTDALQVRGEDQLFSFHSVLGIWRSAAISGAGGFVASITVPAGEIWVVTAVAAFDNTSPVTRIDLYNLHDGVVVLFESVTRAFVAAEPLTWSGKVTLDFGDAIRAYFVGGLAGDTCHIHVCGYRMTLEV